MSAILWTATILFIIGMILVGAELFIPGFGVAGISGIVFLILGAIFTVQLPNGYTLLGIALLIITLVLSLTFGIAIKLKIGKKLVLEDALYEKANEDTDLSYFLGREGVTITSLRPQGVVDFDGVRCDVSSGGPYINEGKNVKVIMITHNKIIVSEMKEDN